MRLLVPSIIGSRKRIDPHWSNVVLLCEFTGADASTIFTDLSDSAQTMTAVSNAQILNNELKTGTTTDLVRVTNHSSLLLGSADFTLEVDITLTSTASSVNDHICGIYDTTGNNRSYGIWHGSTNQFRVYTSTVGSSATLKGSDIISLTTGLPYRIRVVRFGSTFRWWINGALQYDGTQTGTIYAATSDFTIGGFLATSGRNPPGSIDNLRLTTAVARHQTATDYTHEAIGGIPYTKG